MPAKTLKFKEWKAERMKDPEFRAAYEELEPAYQIARLRIERGMTQAELAEKAGTKQPNIARLESGRANPSLAFLRKVASALDSHVSVRIEPKKRSLPKA